jgi:hypothetical protein
VTKRSSTSPPTERTAAAASTPGSNITMTWLEAEDPAVDAGPSCKSKRAATATAAVQTIVDRTGIRARASKTWVPLIAAR